MWVECALRRGITRLELDFFTWGKEISPGYEFPKIEKLQGMLANCVGLNLRDVRLNNVFVSADVIEFMVAHFPIERLSLGFSAIYKLNLSGESVSLKSLELFLSGFYHRISASSLTSLKFSGEESGLLLEHVPRLTELSVDREFCTTFLKSGLQHGVYISGLKRLELAMSEEVVRSSINYPLEFTATLNLEELKAEIHGRKDACFLWPVLLIKAAPFLRQVSVKLHTVFSSERKISGQPNKRRLILIRNAAKQVRNHQCLKTVKFHNFYDHPSESELVQHLLPVLSLEQILISPYPERRTQAKAIAKWLPSSSKAELIVL